VRGQGARLSDDHTPAEPIVAVATFEELFRSNYQGVVGLIAALCGSRAVAEELAQEAFVRAFRRWDRIAAYDRPDAWVRRVAVNLAVSSARRTAAEARAMARVRRLSRRGAEELTAADDEFWRAVRRLPRRQAQCIALRYLEDRSIDDIAAILAVDTATVRVHLHRGRLALAGDLGADADGDA
jgi:RNA polymerase sigma-70 factor, ECF subfamily